MKSFQFRWKDVAPNMVAVQDNEGNVGLLTEEEWDYAIDRANEVTFEQITNFREEKQEEGE